MKAKSIAALLIFSMATSAVPVFAASPEIKQETTRPAFNAFGHFQVHRQGKGVSLNWTVALPREVAYYSIQRSYDGEFFDVIDEIESTGSTRNRFLDTDVFPGIIHYRIIAFNQDGSIMESSVQTVRIVSRK